MRKILPTLELPILLLAALVAGGGLVMAAQGSDDEIRFTDLERQTRELIGYHETIQLTPEQEEVKRQALEAIPAPCCSDNSAYTCCCPCNMAKSSWGLAAWLITEHGYEAEAVREKVEEWIAFINPAGFSGDVCYTGGCNRAFRENGCGGMSSRHLVF